MRHLVLTLSAALGALVLLSPAADAKPRVCTAKAIQQAVIDSGKMDAGAFSQGQGVDLVRCGDVTGDRRTDAVFTIFSGGTAGDVRFGVLRADGKLVLFKQGYKVGVARVSARAFDVLQPHYAGSDPNCCPSSFRLQRWTWTGSRFKAGAVKTLTHAPRRFYS